MGGREAAQSNGIAAGQSGPGTNPGVELLLERPKIPAFVLAGGPAGGEVAKPGGVCDDSDHRPVDALYRNGEYEPWLADGVRAIAMSIIEHSCTHHIVAGQKESPNVKRVYLHSSGV
jgi:hypothetical protein